MSKVTAAITAIGGYVPEYVLTNAELEKMVDTTDEWITSRTGIKERRILKGEGLGTSDLAVPAVQDMLRKRGIQAEDIELLICATTTPDHQFPATANIICDKLGAKNAFGYDISAACSGFIYALVTGSKFIESGQYKKVVVVGADKMSSIIDYTDRATCVIFGDGAGAVLLEPDTDGYGIRDSILRSDGSGRVYLHQKAGGSVKPASHKTVDAGEHFVFQDGQPVFKFAVTNMADVSAEIMEKNKLGADDVAWLVPHQANKRIIDATARRMGVGPEKVMLNIERYGNTTSGTIPLCLWDYEKQLHKGDNLILAAFGGGFTWGSVWVKWRLEAGRL
ncbi:MAG: beta-ketoacyl-ACP synthase III [Bacteroidota bacterium]|jgi:3-oxoacyl-[acyl-carrier-protein] synthase-3|nr:ketoacyl-ACP synthase III [Bacteroidia bacterium]MBP7436326.1 ketoacyl-ACP synthase III [Bacteroidia bacterium]MBP7728098.1 ketoacyl-ACP synthase III [Bacteroidia bacterium]MBP7771279.1 ketoacyl-ACP synthase III [Bacteroidia bacterium]